MAARERKDRKTETDESNRQVGCFFRPFICRSDLCVLCALLRPLKFDFFTVSLPQESARITRQTDESNHQVA